jgi:hypothetical protein
MSRSTLELGKPWYARQVAAIKPQAQLRLRRKELVRARTHWRSVTLTCLEGLVWVTQAGDPEDHMLGKGQALTVARRGRVLVEAMRDARVQVE